MVQVLLEKGTTIRLPAAIALRRTEDIEMLLRREPDCLKPGHRWGTLIVRAAENRADMSIRAPDGRSLRELAEEAGHKDIVLLLDARGFS